MQCNKCLQTDSTAACSATSDYRQIVQLHAVQQVSTDKQYSCIQCNKCLQTDSTAACSATSVYRQTDRQSHLQFTEMMQVVERASGECRQLIVCQNAARKQTGVRLASVQFGVS